jgi:hypothetical protein
MATTVNLMLVLVQQTGELQMTTGGWVFMLGAWAGILSLAAFCFSKVLRNGRKK